MCNLLLERLVIPDFLEDWPRGADTILTFLTIHHSNSKRLGRLLQDRTSYYDGVIVEGHLS